MISEHVCRINRVLGAINRSYSDAVPEKFEVDRVDRIADTLFGVAVAKGLIGYRLLARRVGTRPDFLSQPLDQVSRRASEVGEPLWSALVVSRDGGSPTPASTGWHAECGQSIPLLPTTRSGRRSGTGATPLLRSSGSRPMVRRRLWAASHTRASSRGQWGAEVDRVTEEQRLQQMIDELRRMRERCEPKSNQNPRYLRYSNAVSALLWIIDDLARERH